MSERNRYLREEVPKKKGHQAGYLVRVLMAEPMAQVSLVPVGIAISVDVSSRTGSVVCTRMMPAPMISIDDGTQEPRYSSSHSFSLPENPARRKAQNAVPIRTNEAMNAGHFL
ncbi:hypothetical protein [Ferrovibrio sp.]|uniref:hypothetical protein n=1 Tax=Ferrovibrio sp. TaxID=1917215 RepID=UPI003519688E